MFHLNRYSIFVWNLEHLLNYMTAMNLALPIQSITARGIQHFFVALFAPTPAASAMWPVANTMS
jgi:hypothetical protein